MKRLLFLVSCVAPSLSAQQDSPFDEVLSLQSTSQSILDLQVEVRKDEKMGKDGAMLAPLKAMYEAGYSEAVSGNLPAVNRYIQEVKPRLCGSCQGHFRTLEQEWDTYFKKATTKLPERAFRQDHPLLETCQAAAYTVVARELNVNLSVGLELLYSFDNVECKPGEGQDCKQPLFELAKLSDDTYQELHQTSEVMRPLSL